MYAVIETGGKQYRVQEGDIISVEKRKEPITRFRIFIIGGARETRTLAPVARSTSLAGTPLHQLGYCSVCA